MDRDPTHKHIQRFINVILRGITLWNAGLNIQEINKTKKLMQFVGLLNLWRDLLCSVTLSIDKDIAQKSH